MGTTPALEDDTLFLDEWWLDIGRKRYPTTFALAMRALLADTTSCEIERVNSHAAIVSAPHRQRMSDTQLQNHIMKGYNMHRYQLELKSYKDRRMATRYLPAEEEPPE